ncbi:major facilitator superfamily protein, partial [Kipferlia bialata]
FTVIVTSCLFCIMMFNYFEYEAPTACSSFLVSVGNDPDALRRLFTSYTLAGTLFPLLCGILADKATCPTVILLLTVINFVGVICQSIGADPKNRAEGVLRAGRFLMGLACEAEQALMFAFVAKWFRYTTFPLTLMLLGIGARIGELCMLLLVPAITNSIVSEGGSSVGIRVIEVQETLCIVSGAISVVCAAVLFVMHIGAHDHIRTSGVIRVSTREIHVPTQSRIDYQSTTNSQRLTWATFKRCLTRRFLIATFCTAVCYAGLIPLLNMLPTAIKQDRWTSANYYLAVLIVVSIGCMGVAGIMCQRGKLIPVCMAGCMAQTLAGFVLWWLSTTYPDDSIPTDTTDAVSTTVSTLSTMIAGVSDHPEARFAMLVVALCLLGIALGSYAVGMWMLVVDACIAGPVPSLVGFSQCIQNIFILGCSLYFQRDTEEKAKSQYISDMMVMQGLGILCLCLCVIAHLERRKARRDMALMRGRASRHRKGHKHTRSKSSSGHDDIDMIPLVASRRTPPRYRLG